MKSIMVFHILVLKKMLDEKLPLFMSESFWGRMKKWPLGEGLNTEDAGLINFALNQPGRQSVDLLLSILCWKFVLLSYYAWAMSRSPEAT